jgi:hypothetical protein
VRKSAGSTGGGVGDSVGSGRRVGGENMCSSHELRLLVIQSLQLCRRLHGLRQKLLHLRRHARRFVAGQHHEALELGVDGAAQRMVLGYFHHDRALVSGAARRLRHALTVAPLLQDSSHPLNLGAALARRHHYQQDKKTRHL